MKDSFYFFLYNILINIKHEMIKNLMIKWKNNLKYY